MIVRTVALVSVLALAAPEMLEAREQWGSYGTQQAYNEGYQRGVRSGEDDGRRSESFNYADESDYRRANAGYRREYGNQESYRTEFRRGFEQGYRTGYERYGYRNGRPGPWANGRGNGPWANGRGNGPWANGRGNGPVGNGNYGNYGSTGTISRFRPGSTTATNAGSTTGAIGAATIRLRRAGIAMGTTATTGATARARRTRSCIAMHSGRATSVGTWTGGPTLPVTVRGGRSETGFREARSTLLASAARSRAFR